MIRFRVLNKDWLIDWLIDWDWTKEKVQPAFLYEKEIYGKLTKQF